MSNHEFINRLANPKGWLSGVITNFVAYGFNPETDKIRTGKKGIGVASNYRIDKPSRRETVQLGDGTVELTGVPNRKFNGRYHGEMTWLDDCYRRDENWSEGTITLDEAKMLLYQIA